MKKYFKLTATTAVALVLSGCASVNFDEAVGKANQTTGSFTGGALELSRSAQQNDARGKLAADLLSKPLTSDNAVQLALANSPAVQTMLAQSWADMSAVNQAARIGNPMFTFERVTFKDELELGRLLSFGLLDLLTLPRRQAIAQSQLAQSQVQLSARVVEQVTQTRQAWVRAVAADQVLQYAQQMDNLPTPDAKAVEITPKPTTKAKP